MTEQFQTIVDIVIYFCQLLTSLNHKTAFTVIPFSLKEIYNNNFKASEEQVKFIYSSKQPFVEFETHMPVKVGTPPSYDDCCVSYVSCVNCVSCSQLLKYCRNDSE